MEDMTVQEALDLLMAQDAGEASENEQALAHAAGDAFARMGAASAKVADAPAEDAGGHDGEPGRGADAGRQDAEAPARSFDDGSVGLGVDIVEIARMARILERAPSFAGRVFSEQECAYCDKMANPATHYALRFAAKEAVVKALGTGFSQGIGVRDIEVEREKSGRPSIRLSGRALQIAQEQGVRDLTISLSYTHTDAVACAMALTEAAARASEKRKDPMEELAKQFKETRGILDEL